ncbi:M48 family metallopeptidase [Dokdonella sp. MW10]|uniref:M48 family metallopeptidase n=1 Tax=Dokdonella sp. MW10 TaxID=2992926 RepID=UPI003F81F525
MNFFSHQDLARRASRRMIVMFTIAVVCIVAAVDVVVIFALGLASDDPKAAGPSIGVLVATSACVLAVIGCSTLYRISTLRGGGAAVAAQLGATPVPADTRDLAYRRLRNIVEEIAIASGVPVPQVFVLEQEAAINAFASGYTPADAAVTVTRGCLDKLTRDELQGVIAHEFSHVLNGDMRLNIRLVGVAFGILVIAIAGRKITEVAGYGRSRDGAGFAILGIGLIIVGSIGVFFARLIKASISRQREYLADASAVQFTRQTDGIAGALKKIGGLDEGSKLASSDGEEVAHMLFGDGVGYSRFFATHPALVDRIRRLQPAFDPAEFGDIAADWSQPRRVGASDAADVSIAGFAPARVKRAARRGDAVVELPDAGAELSVSPRVVSEQVGQPDTADYAAASALSEATPPLLAAAARAQERAMALVLALVLDRTDSVRSRQLELVAHYLDTGSAELVLDLAGAVAALHPMQRLPLASLAFPALRRRPRPQLEVFVILLRQIIEADGRVSLDEYCLARLVGVQVVDALNPAAARTMGRLKPGDLAAEVTELFAIVARHGHDDEGAARRAYVAGLHEVLPDLKPVYAPAEAWAIALDRALPRLDLLAPIGKELLVRGLVLAIASDGKVSVAEAELLRTICAALHCPLPPLLQAAR